MTDCVIETHLLEKLYGELYAVKNMDLTVKRGRITAFLGRNGAGKSTTIKMLLGMVQPSGGDAAVLGTSIRDIERSCEARRRVAYVAENKPLYSYMTVEQIVRFTSSFYPDWRPETAKQLLKEYELPLQRKVKALSKGMRTKLALLLAFARRPKVLILDEPSEGLDPVGIEQLLQMLVAQSAEGVSVFFSSHQIAEVERVADEVCILDKGRLLVDASLDDLRQFYRRIDAVFASAPTVRDFQVKGVEKIRSTGRQITVFANGSADAVVERARELEAVSIEVAPVGLRDIFLETVTEN